MKYNNKKWYSVIASVFIVGFLLILSAWVFELVLLELGDNRGREDYLKASATAQWAMELALLSIKQKGYGYYHNIPNNINDESIILSQNPDDISKFSAQDTILSYSMDGKVLSYSGVLAPLGYDIIPLFAFDNDWEYAVSDLDFQILNGAGILNWNILSNIWGIAGQGNFSGSTSGVLRGYDESGNTFVVSNITIASFLSDTSNENNYLILLNSSPTESLTYSIESWGSNQYFTKPRLTIVSSGKAGKFKQNLRTVLDNTEYLSILRYSVFSQ